MMGPNSIEQLPRVLRQGRHGGRWADLCEKNCLRDLIYALDSGESLYNPMRRFSGARRDLLD
jgi:hypothetical protein